MNKFAKKRQLICKRGGDDSPAAKALLLCSKPEKHQLCSDLSTEESAGWSDHGKMGQPHTGGMLAEQEA